MALTPAGEKAKEQIMELLALVRSECHFYGKSPASARVDMELERHVEAVVEALFEAAQERVSWERETEEQGHAADTRNY